MRRERPELAEALAASASRALGLFAGAEPAPIPPGAPAGLPALVQMVAAAPAVAAGDAELDCLATAVWFCAVALLFSQARVRRGFVRLGHWFDRLMGAVLVGLGIKVAFSELH